MKPTAESISAILVAIAAWIVLISFILEIGLPENIVFTSFGIIAGTFTTWAVAKRYYEKAGSDLIKETRELQRLNDLTHRALDRSGLIKFTQDDDGKRVGILSTEPIHTKASSATGIEILVIRAEKPPQSSC